MGSLQEEKQALRAVLRERRRERQTGAAQASAAAAADLAEQFLRAVPVVPRAEVAGYLPIGDEMDVRPLLHRLRGFGHEIALPAVVEPGAPLAFRRWQEGDALADGPFGTRQPLATADELMPDLVILPLLAFDRRGYRLGYGGGYYDRTIAALRRRKKVLAVGAGYGVQEVPAVPCGRHDQVLDWIVTDREAIEPRSVA
ncbi:MAG: 5-formyltetrahydrofolate cyclo-ligase [Alphaproteobacteria bacterium]